MEHNQSDIIIALQEVFNYYEYCTLPFIVEIWEQIYQRHLISKGTSAYNCLLILSNFIESAESYGKIIEKIEPKVISFLFDVANSNDEDWIPLVLNWIESLVTGFQEVTPNIKKIFLKIVDNSNTYL